MIYKQPYKQLLLFFLFLFFMASSSLRAQQLDSSTVALMRRRIRELKSDDYPRPDSVQRLLQSMQPDGNWKGIDYQSIGFSPWPPYSHLTEYVLPLAKAYANPSSQIYHNKRLAKEIHKALDFWLNHNFTSHNWWENDIGVPKTLSTIMILMGRSLTPSEFLQGLNQMRGSYISQTGQNKVWRAEIQLKIGIIEYGRGRSNLLGGARSRIEQASKVLQDEVVVQGKEGIQPDWSFYQHGIQQQFGNYGLSFAATQAEWAYILRGTPYQYSRQKINILRNYILHGLSWVVWKGVMDISGIGRQIFPNSPAEKGERILRVLQLMTKADPDHASKYQQVIQFNRGKASQPPFLKGNTYFWRSALMVDRLANRYISIRMCSKKIQSTESGNGENLLGAHLSDGATYIYQSGEEYKNIFPVWNWHRIPGTTSYSDRKLPEFSWGGLHNGSNFVGGVSDSAYGAVTMLFRRNGLTAHKVWFFVQDGVICLGAGINSDQDFDVLTTLNQSLLNSKITVKKDNRTEILSLGQHANGNDIKWVYHNGIGYLFLQKEQVYTGAVTQRGSWHRVHETASSRRTQRKVFNLWIDHGSQPQNGSYAYMILPDITRNKMNNFAANPGIKILQNTSSLQAIGYAKSNLSEMIFYQAGTVDLGKSLIVSVDTPCLLMVQRAHKELKITISAPPELQKKINLTISGHYRGKDCKYELKKDQTIISFELPKGIYAGQSMSRIIKAV